MSRSPEHDNRSVADELLAAGRERRRVEAMKPPEVAPEVGVRRQIEAAKRRGLATGEDVKPRLLELRMRHRDLTGSDGG